MVYKCQYCGKVYKTENGLTKHKCVIKERYDLVNTTPLFEYWLRFKKAYNITVSKDIEKEKKTFIKSSQYSQFKAFVEWCLTINLYDVQSYLEYLKRYNIPIKHWCSDKYYRKYLSTWINEEHPLIAKDRSKKYLIENGLSLQTISANRLYLLMLSGQVSKKYLQQENFNYLRYLDKGQLQDLGDLA